MNHCPLCHKHLIISYPDKSLTIIKSVIPLCHKHLVISCPDKSLTIIQSMILYTPSVYCPTTVKIVGWPDEWPHFSGDEQGPDMVYTVHVPPFHFVWNGSKLQVRVRVRHLLSNSVLSSSFQILYETTATQEEFYRALIRIPKLKAFL
jgi:hypothetical protein